MSVQQNPTAAGDDSAEHVMPHAVRAHLQAAAEDILRFQRTLHRSPERSWQEVETTRRLETQLLTAGLRPVRFEPTGLFVDVGAARPAFRVGLRADIDALPLQERTGLAWASRNPGVSHCCGHDVHAASLLGAAIALGRNPAGLQERGIGVRFFFQPAEEAHPSGARMVRESGAADDLHAVFATHCDPRTDLGRIGLRRGPITATSDRLEVRVSGEGGHTSRPHLTQDVTFALAKVITELPAILTRILDARATPLLVWGAVHAGDAENVIPDTGVARGTLRMTDAGLWERLGPLVRKTVTEIVAPYGVTADVDYIQGVPPVVNTSLGIDAAALAVADAVGPGAGVEAEQSMGGEDFAWLLQGNEGALVRVGTRTPSGRTYDLHRGDLIVDPRAVQVAANLYAALPFAAFATLG